MNKENTGVLYTAIVCITLIALVLGSFFLVVTDEESPAVQTEVSVILYDAGSDGWDSMLEGMKQAEDDFSANINYVILRESADGEEQLAAIQREIGNGTQGIVVAVCDYEMMYEELEQVSNVIPMLAVESGVGDSMLPLFSADNYEMGKLLGEQILADFSECGNLVVAVESDEIKRDSVQWRIQGLSDTLEGKGTILSLDDVSDNTKVDALVAFHKESLLKLTDTADKVLKDAKRYGIGNTIAIVAALDKGNLEKLVFQNEFNMGYLAIKALIQNISGERIHMPETMDIYCIDRNQVYLPQYEQLLFPIVE